MNVIIQLKYAIPLLVFMDDASEDTFIFGLDFQARSLATLINDEEKSIFIAGTQSLKNENQIYYFAYDENSDQKLFKQTFPHDAGEIWYLAGCPIQGDVFASSYMTKNCKPKCSIWRLKSLQGSTTETLQLNETATIDVEGHRYVPRFLWKPFSASEACILIGCHLIFVDLKNGMEQFNKRKVTVNEDSQNPWTVAKWDPHHDSCCLTLAQGTTIFGWDSRSNKQTYLIEDAHSLCIRDLDFNPNRPYYLMTGANDGFIHFWDIRKTKERIARFAHHSHWVCSVRFNPVHDQLFLSSSTDSKVVLWCAASFSSESVDLSFNNDMEDSNISNIPDGPLREYDDHEESVYCCEWSACDPWVFASLSYDGRIVIKRVPRDLKYTILRLYSDN
ncbi:Protein TSSC1 [Trichinella sp. T6]|nr:Protein TSSC1 [Trichinella sp. T6]